MPRIPYIDLATLRGELAEQIGRRPPVNLYRMLPHAPTIAPGFIRMGLAILQEAELPPRLRELAILRIGTLDRCEYELHHHRRMALTAGLSAEEIEAAIADPGAACFDDTDRAVMRFTGEVVRDVKASPEAYEQVARVLSHRSLVELMMTIGQYMMLSRLLVNLEVEVDGPAPGAPAPSARAS